MTDRARARVRAWMEAEELTQSRAAERLGVSQGAVSQLLNGTTSAPSLALAQALERETRGWKPGPIRTEEWVAKTEAACGNLDRAVEAAGAKTEDLPPRAPEER